MITFVEKLKNFINQYRKNTATYNDAVSFCENVVSNNPYIKFVRTPQIKISDYFYKDPSLFLPTATYNSISNTLYIEKRLLENFLKKQVSLGEMLKTLGNCLVPLYEYQNTKKVFPRDAKLTTLDSITQKTAYQKEIEAAFMVLSQSTTNPYFSKYKKMSLHEKIDYANAISLSNFAYKTAKNDGQTFAKYMLSELKKDSEINDNGLVAFIKTEIDKISEKDFFTFQKEFYSLIYDKFSTNPYQTFLDLEKIIYYVENSGGLQTYKDRKGKVIQDPYKANYSYHQDILDFLITNYLKNAPYDKFKQCFDFVWENGGYKSQSKVIELLMQSNQISSNNIEDFKVHYSSLLVSKTCCTAFIQNGHFEILDNFERKFIFNQYIKNNQWEYINAYYEYMIQHESSFSPNDREMLIHYIEDCTLKKIDTIIQASKNGEKIYSEDYKQMQKFLQTYKSNNSILENIKKLPIQLRVKRLSNENVNTPKEERSSYINDTYGEQQLKLIQEETNDLATQEVLNEFFRNT